MKNVIEVNTYKIKYNAFEKMWQIYHIASAAIMAEFRSLRDAIDYCNFN